MHCVSQFFFSQMKMNKGAAGAKVCVYMAAIKKAGALSVSAFVTHAVFPSGWDRFSKANGSPFDTFFITNSNPTVTDRCLCVCVSVCLSMRTHVQASKGHCFRLDR